MSHDFDDDAVCKRCGFDGAEWWHIEKQKPPYAREPQPNCEPCARPWDGKRVFVIPILEQAMSERDICLHFQSPRITYWVDDPRLQFEATAR